MDAVAVTERLRASARALGPAGAGGTSFRLIDPEGLISEPAHDLGVALRDGNEELLAGDTAAAAVERTGAPRC
jgi:hypothetical protein